MRTVPRKVSIPLSALLLLFLVAVPARAQTAIGVSGGLVFSTLEGDDLEDDAISTATNFNVGANVSFALSEMISVIPGLYYVRKGAESQDVFQGDVVEQEIKLDYLEIPVLLSVAVSQRETFGVSLFAGPEVAFNLSCDADIDVPGAGGSVDCGDDVKSTDFGAIFGAGVNFPLGESLRAVVNGGLDLGLTSIDDSGDDEDVKNSAFFVNLGVSFPVGR